MILQVYRKAVYTLRAQRKQHPTFILRFLRRNNARCGQCYDIKCADRACLCAYQEPYYPEKSLNLVKDTDMAKWVSSSPPPFTGTKYGVTVYQLPDEKYYVRMKSSITGERIKKDPVFKGFRKSSGRMSEASPIASFVYQQLPVKNYPLYREMTGKAMLWLKEGIPAAVIQDRLIKEYLQPEKPCIAIKKLPPRPMPRKMYRRPGVIGRRTVSALPECIVTSERVKGCFTGRTPFEHTLDSLSSADSG